MKLEYRKGFTIVELLIVIVVIAILAAITVVAYNGIQERARDADRKSGITSLQKALELYHIDNGGYPSCLGGTYSPGDPRSFCNTYNSNIIAALVPTYLKEVPRDPVNSGDIAFSYGAGSKKTGNVTYSGTSDDNYIIGAVIESEGGPYITQWGATAKNYMVGSSN